MGLSLLEQVQGGAAGSLLKLSGMSLRERELEALGWVISARPAITTIDMTDSNIGDTGVQAVARALAGNGTVTALGLSGNKIGDAGCGHLARMLAAPGSGLVSLFLRNNSIGHIGCVCVCVCARARACMHAGLGVHVQMHVFCRLLICLHLFAFHQLLLCLPPLHPPAFFVCVLFFRVRARACCAVKRDRRCGGCGGRRCGG